MTGDGKKYIKVYCPKSKSFGLITTDSENGATRITNFYEIDDDTAKNVETSFEGDLPIVSSHLKPCASCGKRTPKCCNKTRQCKVGKGELWYQCLFCSGLEICTGGKSEGYAGSAEFFFLMDKSGSMRLEHRKEAANAVRTFVRSLQGKGNAYSFVAWGSSAKYVFSHETSLSKMSSALASYENYETGESTAAHLAFEYIKDAVFQSDRPVRILLVTDGYFDDEKLAIEARNKLLKKQNVEILAIGITGANDSSLAKIGTVPAFSRVVGGSKALTSTFEQIAEILKKKGNNF